MHEVALRKQMNRTLAQFKKDPIPHGPGVRPMTPQEVESYSQVTADMYRNCEMADNMVWEGVPIDKDPAKGKIRTSDRQISHGDNQKTEYKESLKASFGGRSKAFEFVQENSNKVLPNGEFHSETMIGAGANNIGHITGLVMERCDDSLTVTQYYIDRLHPEQSLIYRQEPTTAREFPMLLGK